jgi:hypothetical protein
MVLKCIFGKYLWGCRLNASSSGRALVNMQMNLRVHKKTRSILTRWASFSFWSNLNQTVTCTSICYPSLRNSSYVMPATYQAHLPLIWSPLTIFGEKYKLRCSSGKFLSLSVPSSHHPLLKLLFYALILRVRDEVSYPHKTREKTTHLNLYFETDDKTKDSKLNGSKYFPNLICYSFLRYRNFDLLLYLPHFQSL